MSGPFEATGIIKLRFLNFQTPSLTLLFNPPPLPYAAFQPPAFIALQPPPFIAFQPLLYFAFQSPSHSLLSNPR